jgi:hypothetical protein
MAFDRQISYPAQIVTEKDPSGSITGTVNYPLSVADQVVSDDELVAWGTVYKNSIMDAETGNLNTNSEIYKRIGQDAISRGQTDFLNQQNKLIRDTQAMAITQGISDPSLFQPIAPQYVTAPGLPGAAGADGAVFTLGPNGEVYRDAVQMPGLAAQTICTFGLSLYAKGKTQPDWWKWTGAAWVKVTAVDKNVLN